MFRQLAMKAAQVVGSGPAFLLAMVVTVAWMTTGPYFHYSNTWQLVINTVTSVATFLIVFLIQNTQNRDTAVIQLKLDELIRAVKQARTELVQMEGLTDEQLETLRDEFRTLRERATTTRDSLNAPLSQHIENSDLNGAA
jgi:low affinity Fe/Cu permease